MTHDAIPVNALATADVMNLKSSCAVLAEVFRERVVVHPDGRNVPLVANISIVNCNALYAFVRDRRPQRVVEIGMAHGVSTLSILSALEDNGAGELISIDPYIGWPTGEQIALHQVARAGLDHRHEHRRECSHEAMPKLLANGEDVDFVYIDGCHNFDYAFVDCFFADKMLRENGVIGFNDAGWRSVFKVIRYLTRYRKYQELDVGLPRVFRSSNPLFSLIKRLEGRSKHDRYFEKAQDWEPEPGFHTNF